MSENRVKTDDNYQGLNHFDAHGVARMVDVGTKADTVREAVAKGELLMNPATLTLIEQGQLAKGDVLGVARVAGIMAVKETSRLIPLAHPIAITGVQVDFQICPPNRLLIEAKVRTTGKTGVEMEALTAAAVAGLTVYDMCKAVDRDMVLNAVRLVRKSGGASGNYERTGELS